MVGFFEEWLAGRTLAKEALSLKADAARLEGETNASQHRQEGQEIASDWAAAEEGFRRERIDLERDLKRRRIAAFCEPGGVLNFDEKASAIRDRFKADWDEAKLRLEAATRGLRLYYGYETSLPDPATIEGLVSWARKTINVMVRWSHSEQRTAVVVSLWKELGEAAFRRGLDSGEFTVGLDAERFPAYFVRLRGVKVYVEVRSSSAALWPVRVKCPARSTIRHRDGTDGTKDLDQSDIPDVRIGCAHSRSLHQDVPLAGTMSTYNASPIGEWMLTILTDTSVDGQVPRKEISDVVLELDVVYQNSPAPMSRCE